MTVSYGAEAAPAMDTSIVEAPAASGFELAPGETLVPGSVRVIGADAAPAAASSSDAPPAPEASNDAPPAPAADSST